MSRAPLALKLYSLLVLGVAAVAPDYDGGMWWVGMVLVALPLLWALIGSRFAWWIQVVALGASIAGVVRVWQSYGDDTLALRVFVPPATLTAVTVMLGAAAVLLLLPRTRSYCTDRSDGPQSVVGIALGAWLLGAFPAMGLSLDPRLPSDGIARSAPNRSFVGYDPTVPSAIFVGERDREPCLVILEPRSGSSTCDAHDDHAHNPARTGELAAWVLPKNVSRVSVVYKGGTAREARLLDASERANVFYTTESLDEVRGIRGYDASGEKVIRCRFYC